MTKVESGYVCIGRAMAEVESVESADDATRTRRGTGVGELHTHNGEEESHTYGQSGHSSPLRQPN
jgi:hypothetical protein